VAKILKRLPRDVNSRAVAIARAAIGDDDQNIDTRTIGTISTAKTKARQGGVGRAKSLSSTRRTAIAKTAASARWQKK